MNMSDPNPATTTCVPSPSYRRIVEHYEACLARHGDNHLGVDWPRRDDADKRYAVMLGLIRPDQGARDNPVSLLDFGCGAGHLYEYLVQKQWTHIDYSGLDLSEHFVALCRAKHPGVKYYCADILEDREEPEPRFDYVVANGVFTEKREVPFEAMLTYFEKALTRLFSMARIGMAFNLMSKHVDWERVDLFHVPLDTVAAILSKNISRHFLIRNDYGLYEYTIYVYREPTAWPK
jgi:SAM-dependent methyltransferase